MPGWGKKQLNYLEDLLPLDVLPFLAPLLGLLNLVTASLGLKIIRNLVPYMSQKNGSKLIILPNSLVFQRSLHV
jgi:hypothetical protein